MSLPSTSRHFRVRVRRLIVLLAITSLVVATAINHLEGTIPGTVEYIVN